MDRRLVLQRLKDWPEGHGTPGLIHTDTDSMRIICRTVELPWRDNALRISRIPAGRYAVQPHSSERFPRALHLRDVPGRSAILIHPGNWGGDPQLGCRTDLLGCIAPCLRHGRLDGQRAGIDSRTALEKLMTWRPEWIEVRESRT